jgi:hypothetical protein
MAQHATAMPFEEDEIRPQLACWECGATTTAACNCGVSYVPAGARAAAAVANNPEKSDRAIAADIGVAKNTVRAARQELVNTDQLEDGPRIGLDGKTRKLPERQTVSYIQIETKPPEPRVVSVTSRAVFTVHDMFAFEQYVEKVCQEAIDRALADRFEKVTKKLARHTESLKRRKR